MKPRLNGVHLIEAQLRQAPVVASYRCIQNAGDVVLKTLRVHSFSTHVFLWNGQRRNIGLIPTGSLQRWHSTAIVRKQRSKLRVEREAPRGGNVDNDEGDPLPATDREYIMVQNVVKSHEACDQYRSRSLPEDK